MPRRLQWLAMPVVQPAIRTKTLCLIGLLIAAAFASSIPPAAMGSGPLTHLLPGIYLTWVYACSIVVGALPYVSAGAAAAVAIEVVARKWCLGRARMTALAFALLFPGCDCAMSSFAGYLRLLPPRLAVACITWSSCCNPVALVCTAGVLGMRMLALRMCGGFIAAALSAIVSSIVVSAERCSIDSGDEHLAGRFSGAAATALSSLCLAACLSALLLVYRPHVLASATPAAAAIFGSLLSPCSTADAVLAGAFFRKPQAQLSFILASQALDFRQLALLQRVFGRAVMLRCAAAALTGLAAACQLAA